MTDKQREVAVDLFAGWLDKASVGCLLVGMFQKDHIFGGIIGSIACFLAALTLKIWRAQDE